MSDMRQAMETWLRRECIDTGQSLFDIYHGWNNLYDAIFRMSIGWSEEEISPSEWSVNQVRDTANSLSMRIRENASLSETEKDKLNATVESILHEIPPAEWPMTQEVMQNLMKLQTELQNSIMEKVVECQVGKPGSTLSNPGGDKLAELKDKLKEQITGEIEDYGKYVELAAQAGNLGKKDIEDALTVIAGDERRHRETLEKILEFM